GGSKVDPEWYALVVVGVVIAIDLTRTVVSLRGSKRYSSPALASNALHFGSDLAGSLAVLLGLVSARAGYADGDSIAALFVAVLVVAAAQRLMRRNVDVLMDRAPADAESAARAAIRAMEPSVELRRLRMRQAAGRQFADVVIGVSPSAAVGQGHAAADAVEEAVGEALPGADVVVHVEPVEVANVREVHNIALVDVDGRTELSLHVKLPGELTLEDAHAIAERLERSIRAAVPEIAGVQTHLEPLT